MLVWKLLWRTNIIRFYFHPWQEKWLTVLQDCFWFRLNSPKDTSCYCSATNLELHCLEPRNHTHAAIEIVTNNLVGFGCVYFILFYFSSKFILFIIIRRIGGKKPTTWLAEHFWIVICHLRQINEFFSVFLPPPKPWEHLSEWSK